MFDLERCSGIYPDLRFRCYSDTRIARSMSRLLSFPIDTIP